MPAASVRAAAGALTFLTRVPLARVVEVDAGDVARGALLFPLVGAGVGAAWGALAAVLHIWLTPLLAAALGVAAGVLLTGALHVDALADTADAAGARTRERALEVMRDPRVGSFGATALVLDLLVKVSAVAVLLERGGALGAVVAAGALSRAAAPALAAALPYPRAEGGPGSVLTGRLGVVRVAVGSVLAVAVAVVIGGAAGAVLAAAAAATAVMLGVVYRQWLGGATGDCLGAATELTETVVLVTAAGLA